MIRRSDDDIAGMHIAVKNVAGMERSVGAQNGDAKGEEFCEFAPAAEFVGDLNGGAAFDPGHGKIRAFLELPFDEKPWSGSPIQRLQDL